MVSARVENTGGLGVTGVPVNFTADAGTLSAASANTDDSGVASVTLTTTRKSTVTANVAGKTANVVVDLNPRTGLVITAPTTADRRRPAGHLHLRRRARRRISATSPSTGATASSQSLGAISGAATASHTYTASGHLHGARDGHRHQRLLGDGVVDHHRAAGAAAVGAGDAVEPQPAGSTKRSSCGRRSRATPRASSATTGTSAPGASTPPISTTSNQVPVSWNQIGTKVITVTAIQASGPSGDGLATVNVQQ